MTTPSDQRWLALAARLAIRGHGGAEPNPMVGCVVVNGHSELIGWGYHARCGMAHAEVVALARAGANARGATAFVTLEPCAHHGRTPPCCDALIAAGVTRVVFGVADPHPSARGGAARLREAGIDVAQIQSKPCERVSAPFLCRIGSKRPWIIAKWAQTIDGRTATRSGDSRWISGARSRAMVHRERARVDAVMVGVGTVLADDPHLLPRIAHARRIPRRLVIDPRLATPIDAQVVRTVSQGPVEIAALASAIDALDPHKREALTTAGVVLTPIGEDRRATCVSFRALPQGALTPLMRDLHRRGVSTVLCEGGAGLIGALHEEDLIDIAWSFTAGLTVGDASGTPIAMGPGPLSMGNALPMNLIDHRERGGDLCAIWQRAR